MPPAGVVVGFQAIQQIAEGKPTADSMSEVFAHVFLAMTDARLGRTDQAEQELEEANRLADVTPIA